MRTVLKKNILLSVFVVLLVIPALQDYFKIFIEKPLQGAIIPAPDTILTPDAWFSGRFQLVREKFLNENFGYRNFFVRVNNQIAYSLYSIAKANGVIIGKENYLYEKGYINAYYGKDFIGMDSVSKRMQQLKFIQDTLSKLNKNLIVIFAAGKGSFYPEYFPENLKSEKGITNYSCHIKLAKEKGLSFIDFNKYFIENKSTSKYPLYPQYGIHWSYYSTCIVADSIIRYIEKTRNIDMPNLFWDTIEFDDAKEIDYDIADGMNLLFKLGSFKMAYPKIQLQSDSNKIKPSVLVVADSYYWGMFNFGISNAFSNSHFWFYNQQIYPDSYQSPLETSQVDLGSEIAKHDVIIIMATEATLPNLGWGFINKAYNLFNKNEKNIIYDTEFQRKIVDMRNYIKTDKNWMEQIKKKAEMKSIKLDSMLTLDAIWAINKERK